MAAKGPAKEWNREEARGWSTQERRRTRPCRLQTRLALRGMRQEDQTHRSPFSRYCKS